MVPLAVPISTRCVRRALRICLQTLRASSADATGASLTEAALTVPREGLHSCLHRVLQSAGGRREVCRRLWGEPPTAPRWAAESGAMSRLPVNVCATAVVRLV